MKKGALHEDLRRDLDVVGSSDRAFGLVFAGFFLVVGLGPLLRGGSPRVWTLGLAVLWAGVAFVRPTVLAPLNRWWSRLGLLLQGIVSPVILALLFFLTIVPIGLLMRLLGKNPLRLGFESNTPSYWIQRRPPGPAPHTMRNQF